MSGIYAKYDVQINAIICLYYYPQKVCNFHIQVLFFWLNYKVIGKFQKEAAQQVSACKPLPFHILSMNLYMSWVVSKLLEYYCNVTGRYRITRRGLRQNLYTTYNLCAREKLLVYYNIAQCMRSGHRNCSATGREMPLF